MREIDFLPPWYPQHRRHRQIVILESWVLAVLVVGFGVWVTLSRRNVRAAEATVARLQDRLAHTQTEQKSLDEQLTLKKELETRQRLIASLGFPVEMTRILKTIEGVMPNEMSLLDINCDTVEQVREVRPLTAPTAVRGGSQQPREKYMDRRLNVRLVGVAPNDLDLARFLAGLSTVPVFEQVALTYARDKLDGKHVLREFEVTFSIDLNQGSS
jgi:Tfp pilus assembly protein PilN